jgi:membrane protein YdbS with pleckstrin-like domain
MIRINLAGIIWRLLMLSVGANISWVYFNWNNPEIEYFSVILAIIFVVSILQINHAIWFYKHS